MYCRKDRHFMRPAARDVLVRAARRVAAGHPGAVVRYMEASWPSGERPMPPHLSHGDGRQIDLAIFYEDRAGRALRRPPLSPRLARGYGAYEPPRREVERVCAGAKTSHDRPDPPAGRAWRMDGRRTEALIAALLAARQVRRIFVEPHLKARLGFSSDGRVRFAGCNAARHDDHLHVDFR
jgi:murein endopeptidase